LLLAHFGSFFWVVRVGLLESTERALAALGKLGLAVYPSAWALSVHTIQAGSDHMSVLQTAQFGRTQQ
jgi:hypothetical protein